VVYTAFNIRVGPATSFIEADAGIAQLVEQLICNSRESFCAGFHWLAHRCGR